MEAPPDGSGCPGPIGIDRRRHPFRSLTPTTITRRSTPVDHIALQSRTKLPFANVVPWTLGAQAQRGAQASALSNLARVVFLSPNRAVSVESFSG